MKLLQPHWAMVVSLEAVYKANNAPCDVTTETESVS